MGWACSTDRNDRNKTVRLWGNGCVNDELEDKSKSRDDSAKSRTGLVSEAMHNSSE